MRFLPALAAFVENFGEKMAAQSKMTGETPCCPEISGSIEGQSGTIGGQSGPKMERLRLRAMKDLKVAKNCTGKSAIAQ